MLLYRQSYRGFLACLICAALLAEARGTGSNVVRLAVGPFFAATANENLRPISALLPELIAAELSRQSRFQLVEREKVTAIWGELHLNASGLAARESVARLGQMLACDWLVSGSLVQTGPRTQVWTKVIDVRSGVVLDMDTLPCQSTDLAQTVSGIAAFVAKAGTQRQPRQFITLGRFTDMNPALSAGRADWSRQIPALIERHFHASGYGVAELEAVTPIFEEHELGKSGLAGSGGDRVKLQPAFWLVDGGCEWVPGTPDKLNVGLRVQKVGAAEQIFRFTALPGEETEKLVLETITKALVSTNFVAAAPAPKAEADVQTARGMELATRNSPFRQATAPTANSQDEMIKSMEEHQRRGEENRRATLATYERTILLDPKNLEAKTMLGYGLLGDRDAAQRQRGKDLLSEVVASKDPKYAERAQKHLNNADMLARVAANNDAGMARARAEVERRNAEAAKLQARRSQLTNISNASSASAPRTNPTDIIAFFKFPAPVVLGQCPTMTAAALVPDGALVASGTSLFHSVIETKKTEKIPLPPGIQPINALMWDNDSLWLGTDGSGLLQISWSGTLQRSFGEKDGLLMSKIQALALFGGRVWIGFGSANNGGIGYLEIASGKFIPLTSVAALKTPDHRQDGPPVDAVTAIKTADEKTLWVGTSSSLKHFEIGSGKWSTPLAFAPRGVTVEDTFVAVGAPTGGVLVCQAPWDRWEQLNLGQTPAENVVPTLRAEGRRIWVGGEGKIRYLDLRDQCVVGDCNFDGGTVRWIYAARNPVIWFIADGPTRDSSILYQFMRRPSTVMQARGN